MTYGIVIDAHLIQSIRESLVSESGSLFDLISWITSNCGIAISELIETHWKQHCTHNDLFFWEWYAQQILTQKIRIYKPTRISGRIFMNIRVNYKLPNDIFVRAYLDCANNTIKPRYILTEDMYFYEPSAKSMTPSRQIQIRTSRSGSLCRHLENTLKIRVGTESDFCRHFGIESSCHFQVAIGCIENCVKSP